jgi:hypothetical protein
MLKPFGMAYRNRRGHEKGSACAHCGRSVREPWTWYVEVIHGGASYVRSDLDLAELEAARADQASYMGCYPVGPECRKALQLDGVAVGKWRERVGPAGLAY